MLVRDVMTKEVFTLRADDRILVAEGRRLECRPK